MEQKPSNYFKSYFFIYVLFFVFGCQTEDKSASSNIEFEKKNDELSLPSAPLTEILPKVEKSENTPASPAPLADEKKDLGNFIHDLDTKMDDVHTSKVPNASPEASSAVAKISIPLEINDNVMAWIQYFTERHRERFVRFMERGGIYKDIIMDILKQYDIPKELYYLALIESGFVTSAKSRANAVGVWQFVRETGQRYGLTVNQFVDERRDPIRATHAAAKYLKDLHNVFQSWYLAMAAYNAGERRIMSAIMSGNSRNFWTLVKKRVLPNETVNYIPKFIAAAMIGQYPDAFGITINKENPLPELEAVTVPSPVSLKDIANSADCSFDLMKRLNPHLLRGITSPISREYQVWVPRESADSLKSAELKLVQRRIVLNLRPSYDNESSKMNATSGIYHRVQKGENLVTIARKYNVSPAHLKEMNHLRSKTIYAGQKIKITGNIGHLGFRQKTPLKYKTDHIFYKVRKGDNLVVIARKFKMTIPELKRLNKRLQNRIYIGQLLKVNNKQG